MAELSEEAVRRLKRRIRRLWGSGRFLVHFGLDHIDEEINAWLKAEQKRAKP
jgi:hypothetical protein